MRTPESKIKEAILHPTEEIRRNALSYFSRSFTEDTDVMPLVIEAVKKYGPVTSVRILQSADVLPQTEATIQWLADELSKEWDLAEINQDNYCFTLGLILCQSPPALLRPEMTELRSFPEELRERFLERLDMARWDWETGWTALESLGNTVRDRGMFRLCDVRREKQVIESLARHRDKASEILPLLHRNYRGKDRDLMEWLELALVTLAGQMRLEEAVPILVERLHEDDFELVHYCAAALAQIGTDTVVRTIAEHWPEGQSDFRESAANVLQSIHTDLSTEKCLEFLRAENPENDDVWDSLAEALLAQFVAEAVEPIREIVLDREDSPDPVETPLVSPLVSACTVMGTSFAEYEQWYQELAECSWGRGDYEPARIRENFTREFEQEEEDEEDFDEEWADQFGEDYEDDYDEEDDLDDGELDEGPDVFPPVEPIRNTGPVIGRNDPCPCGSGKKFKKCCLKSGRYEPDAK